MPHPLWYTIYMKMKNDELNKAFDRLDLSLANALDAIEDFHSMDINKTTEPSLETQRDKVAHRTVSRSWDRQIDMNGDVYVRENEDYLDRD